MAINDSNSNQDVKINLKADISEATRSLRDLQRQVNKLGDVADQGDRKQRGFLSPKQVEMYRKIMSEIQNTHGESMRKMADAESRYNARFEREEYKKLKQLEDNLKKRQEAVRRAEGGNKWGDVASPSVQEYHRHKLNESQEQLNSHQNSSQFKSAVQDTKNLEAQLNILRGSIEDLRTETERANGHAGRINNMTQQNQDLRREVVGATGAVAAAGAITTVGAYAKYTLGGMDHLRQQELQASGVTQKLGTTGYEKADAKHRDSVQLVGEANQYSMADTLALQGVLAKSGITDAEKLNKDTDSVQKFSRSYATDPNLMADGNSMLRQMGSIEEGQMQRFAELIGGAISKNGMGGREEEMLRATTNLASSVSQGMDKLTSSQLGNLVGLQTQVGEVDSLRGERGANLLNNMDNAIKNGDSNFDLLMGKGTEFQGLEGMRELGFLKEQGISNPENLQRVLQNSERMFGDATGSMTEMALSEQGMMSQHEFRALKDAGILDKWKNGEFASADELENAGATDMADQIRQWDGTESKDFKGNEARDLNLQSDHAKFAEDGATGLKSLWHSLPDPVQHTILPAAALAGGTALLGAGKYIGKGWDKLTRGARGTIGGNGGMLGKLGNGAKTVAKGAGKLLGPASVVGGASMATDAGQGVGDWLFGHQEGQQKMEGLFSNPFNGSEKYTDSKQGAISKGWDWLTGSNNEAEASGLDTKAEANAVSNVDKMYGANSPLGDMALKQSGANPDTLNVASLNINDKAFGDYFTDKNSTDKTESRNSEVSKYTSNSLAKNQQTIKILVEGKIDGVTADTEGEVKNSFKDYFTGLFNGGGNSTQTAGLDLSYDQRRT